MRTVASSPRLDSTDFAIRVLGVCQQFVSDCHGRFLSRREGPLDTNVPTVSPLTILSMFSSSAMLKT